MTFQYENVKDFMTAFGQDTPETIKMPDYKTQTLRHRLIEEESMELYNAKNIVEYTDAIIDILYVTLGAAIAAGIGPETLQHAWNEVHRSNMSKFWNGEEVEKAPKSSIIVKLNKDRYIVRDPNGKVIKSPGYSKANLEFVKEAK